MKTDGRAAPPSLSYCCAVLVVSACLAVLYHHVIYENDLFWMIRAGEEIFQGNGVQTVDRWSWPVAGRPWFNFEWLSTVLFYLVSRLGADYRWFPALRVLLAFLTFGAVGALVYRPERRPRTSVLIAVLLLPALCLTVGLGRLGVQTRPDTFGGLSFLALLFVWTRDCSWQRKALAGTSLLVLWANLHAGTVLFGIGLQVLALVAGLREERRPGPRLTALLCVATLATWVLTPIGTNVIQVMLAHTTRYDWRLTYNVDERPLGMELFDPSSEFAPRLYAWLASVGLALLAYRSVARESLPESYARPAFFYLGTTGLTVIFFLRVRSLQYEMFFLLPVLAAGLGKWGANWSRKIILGVSAAVFVAWTLAASDVARHENHATALERLKLPVRSIEFLKRERPRGNILNALEQGGFLIDNLREYPVELDPRGHLYIEFLREFGPIWSTHDQQGLARFLSKHDVNTILTTPEAVFDELVPVTEWSLVFAETSTLVFVRRIPAHAALNARHEYHEIYHGRPPTFAAMQLSMPARNRALFERELDRCLAEAEDNLYCLSGKMALLHFVHHDDAAAFALAARGLRVAPESAEFRAAVRFFRR